MANKTSLPSSERARRFALHLPIYFRQPHSAAWLEGTTENISYTGVLFRSPSPLVPETAVELRLQLATRAIQNHASEIRCKGAVVRVEQRNAPETPVALAVAINDYRIVRHGVSGGIPSGISENTEPPPKARRHVH
jgi:hypothetical protein